MTSEHLWRYRDAARFLGVSPATVRGLVARRAIPHLRIGRRIVLFDPAQLREWLAAHAVEPTRPARSGGGA